MTPETDPLEVDLAALRSSTADARPSAAFAAALGASLAREGPVRRWSAVLSHQARRALVLALLSLFVLGAVLWKLERTLSDRRAQEVLGVEVLSP